ncbi:nucleoside ABC transporter ATP-binding protein [Natranaerovirga pectinivora]|uniref:Nucleoside ABC transporter ATP-binding protein n=1 Tax=Natranaerovirga pectinivora TaxID=682400 RepID=A0A4R3MPI8_9FIRM|nr:ABC transporter ATP-binding protein [Natranaerovirga pectinivora]TCT16742.1 nucleoside ABC transporter ATP-binding protein [Natranaerovirga pectinivora]
MCEQEVVRIKDITKVFGNVIANENVNLTLKKGEIHAILGENGAGKSTLMNMLSGIYTPDSGSIFINGEEIKFRSPMESIKNGIGMIHQHFKLVNVFTALDNIIAGKNGKILIRKKEAKKNVMKLMEEIGLDMNLDKSIYEMSISEKQTVEIIKALFRGGNILILDEPTAVLTPQETVKLFDLLKKMKEKGCTIVIITHKLNEVMDISDVVTILRHGKTIKTVKTIDTSPKELTDLMVGKKVVLEIERKSVEKQEEILKVDNITLKDINKVKRLDNITFALKSGEILGIAGVAGSGQKELCEVLAGLIQVDEGEITYKGDKITGLSPREQYNKNIRIGFVPEDRLGMGLIPSMDIVENLLLKEYQKEKGYLIKKKPIIKKAKKLVDKLEIKCPGIKDYPVKILSGGNIQKVLIGREIDAQPDILITAYPVRGLDIGASFTIYDLLNEEKSKGVGIIFVGEDLDILLSLADRILVLCQGKVMGIVDAKKVSKEEIGWLMAGEVLEEAIQHA